MLYCNKYTFLQGLHMKITVLTGAGISAESGISTFRDKNGLWENHRMEDVATPEAFQSNPELVQRFYNQRRAQLNDPNIAPNDAHLELAKLEEKIGQDFFLITQNVDNLHERAGNKRVLHMHGELTKIRCVQCQNIQTHKYDITSKTKCDKCQSLQTMRPNIVWFGEMPIGMEIIYEKLSQTDYFFSIGTSGLVYPAAMLVEIAKQAGAKCIELNLESTPNSDVFDESIKGKAATIVKQYLRQRIYPLLE